MLKQLPWPKDWQDFERLCHGLWTEIWGDPATQRHGRTGQSQHGVDVFGRLPASGDWGGIQCKGRDHYPPAPLGEDELKEEVKKALSFSPKLTQFILATVSPRDAKIQAVARSITTSNRKKGLFSVSVWSWDDICDELGHRPTLLKRFFPELGLEDPLIPHREDGIVSFVIFPDNPRKLVHAAFLHPEVIASIAEPLRLDVRFAILELILNAFEHGSATRCEIRISHDKISVIDNGKPFDPTKVQPIVKKGRGAGLSYFKKFCEKYHEVLEVGHQLKVQENNVELRFSTPISIPLNNLGCSTFLNGRVLVAGGDELAKSVRIGDDCIVFTCVFEPDLYLLSASFLYVFLRALVRRLPSHCVLMVVLPSQTELLQDVIEDLARRDKALASRIRIGKVG